MDALQSQAMAQAQQRRRDAHKQALQAALADLLKTSLVIVWSAEKRLRRRGC